MHLARTRPDEGAAVVEYVGMIVAVVALLVSLVALATPIGNDINQVICKAISSIGGGGACGAQEEAEGGKDGGETTAKAPPKFPCVQGSNKNSQNVTLSVSVFDGKSSGTVKLDRLSDGTYVATVTDKLGADAVARAGGVGASLKDKGIDIGASASIGVASGSETKYTFADEAAAQEFMDWATGRNKANMVPVVGGFAYDAVNWFSGGYSPPEPSSSVIVVEGGVAAQASASADFGLAAAKGKVSGDAVAGATINVVTGETTTYLKASLSADVMAEMGLSMSSIFPPHSGLDSLPMPGDPSVELKDMRLAKQLVDAGIKVEVTERNSYDADGNLTKKSMVFSWSGGIDSPLSDGSGRNGEIYTADIQVTDENRSQVENSGWPWVAHPFETAVDLGGDVTKLNVSTSSEEEFNAKIKAEATGVGGLGLSVQSGNEMSTTTDAAYLNEKGEWVRWDECL
ncbi:MAG: hypothetical protein FWD11_02360 [Micrococcales bacterium]|nr:hypothetical protein [Micrococcales bacterium]